MRLKEIISKSGLGKQTWRVLPGTYFLLEFEMNYASCCCADGLLKRTVAICGTAPRKSASGGVSEPCFYIADSDDSASGSFVSVGEAELRLLAAGISLGRDCLTELSGLEWLGRRLLSARELVFPFRREDTP